MNSLGIEHEHYTWFTHTCSLLHAYRNQRDSIFQQHIERWIDLHLDHPIKPESYRDLVIALRDLTIHDRLDNEEWRYADGDYRADFITEDMLENNNRLQVIITHIDKLHQFSQYNSLRKLIEWAVPDIGCDPYYREGRKIIVRALKRVGIKYKNES